jgi:hypothetical protein
MVILYSAPVVIRGKEIKEEKEDHNKAVTRCCNYAPAAPRRIHLIKNNLSRVGPCTNSSEWVACAAHMVDQCW